MCDLLLILIINVFFFSPEFMLAGLWEAGLFNSLAVPVYRLVSVEWGRVRKSYEGRRKGKSLPSGCEYKLTLSGYRA